MFRSLITGLPLKRKVKPLRHLTSQQEHANVGGPQAFTGQPLQMSAQGKQMGYQVAANKFPSAPPPSKPSSAQIGGPQIQGGAMSCAKSKKGANVAHGGSVSSCIASPAKFVKKRNLVTHY